MNILIISLIILSTLGSAVVIPMTIINGQEQNTILSPIAHSFIQAEAGKLNFTGKCTKEIASWFHNNFGNIEAKVYFDIDLQRWRVAYYDDNGDLFKIPKLRGYYDLKTKEVNEKSDRLLSNDKKKEYAEYYACVFMRHAYEYHADKNLNRPDGLVINIDIEDNLKELVMI